MVLVMGGAGYVQEGPAAGSHAGVHLVPGCYQECHPYGELRLQAGLTSNEATPRYQASGGLALHSSARPAGKDLNGTLVTL